MEERDEKGRFIRGHKVPKDIRDKIRNTKKELYKNKEVKIWNKGLTKETDERLREMGEKRRGRILPQEWKEKIKNNHWTKKDGGIKEEIGKRISITLKEGHKEGRIKLNSGCFKKYSQRIKEIRRKKIFPIKDTSIELKIQNFLKQLNIEFFTHQYMEIEHSYQCDIFVPSMNLVIECDGDYWHKYPTGTELDNIRTKELIEKGFKILRLWEFFLNFSQCFYGFGYIPHR